MKTLLNVLAGLYLVLCIGMFFVPFAIITQVLGTSFTADSFLMIILALVFLVIPLIGIFCGIRYLRKKDLESACDISVITGILECIIAAGLLPLSLGRIDAWMKFVLLMVSIVFGLIIHRIFQRNIQRHFGA